MFSNIIPKYKNYIKPILILYTVPSHTLKIIVSEFLTKKIITKNTYNFRLDNLLFGKFLFILSLNRINYCYEYKNYLLPNEFVNFMNFMKINNQYLITHLFTKSLPFFLTLNLFAKKKIPNHFLFNSSIMCTSLSFTTFLNHFN